ncbi:type II toxin-antitoxin system VapC family toxin [Psychrobacter sp. I-STPA10]|uniref:type II toxin-antitoxin system VapC family toxin n=1 Tax=Psychrobacter sp. I-STPA10 TaxID=2585769 RepID=UPI001E403532|nr:type II toxin-antitoxin system VapC family toxin [Psychrobacter sp. I-STPA10]
MKYLLDTHVLIWFLTQNCKQLSAQTLKILNEPSNILYFSTASIWEMTIKASLDKPNFQYDPKMIVDELLNLGFIEMNILLPHVLDVGNLPQIHRDPFDRLLLVQAKIEGVKLLTADNHIVQYQQSYVIDVRC